MLISGLDSSGSISLNIFFFQLIQWSFSALCLLWSYRCGNVQTTCKLVYSTTEVNLPVSKIAQSKVCLQVSFNAWQISLNRAIYQARLYKLTKATATLGQITTLFFSLSSSILRDLRFKIQNKTVIIRLRALKRPRLNHWHHHPVSNFFKRFDEISYHLAFCDAKNVQTTWTLWYTEPGCVLLKRLWLISLVRRGKTTFGLRRCQEWR